MRFRCQSCHLTWDGMAQHECDEGGTGSDIEITSSQSSFCSQSYSQDSADWHHGGGTAEQQEEEQRQEQQEKPSQPPPQPPQSPPPPPPLLQRLPPTSQWRLVGGDSGQAGATQESERAEHGALHRSAGRDRLEAPPINIAPASPIRPPRGAGGPSARS